MGRVSPTKVAVVYNLASKESQLIARYYAAKRHIPATNLFGVKVRPSEEIRDGEYQTLILAPVKKFLSSKRGKLDYVVLTKFVPIRVKENGCSVDSLLASMDMNVPLMPARPSRDQIIRSLNPYFEKRERFSHAKFGLYLVTRLDGYTVADAKALVDRSIQAKPERGLFFMDEAENRKKDSYGSLQATMSLAQTELRSKGLSVYIDETPEFVAPTQPLMGYASWGSNDGKFDPAEYHRLKFKNGSVGETFVSTSGRTFNRTIGGQSLVADLIAQGLTGVKGYVSEPYTIALARPNILFERYLSGFNLAESFYMASPVIKWKDLVIGDPLCAPYAKNGS